MSGALRVAPQICSVSSQLSLFILVQVQIYVYDINLGPEQGYLRSPGGASSEPTEVLLQFFRCLLACCPGTLGSDFHPFWPGCGPGTVNTHDRVCPPIS